jgi:hypothetical protein
MQDAVSNLANADAVTVVQYAFLVLLGWVLVRQTQLLRDMHASIDLNTVWLIELHKVLLAHDLTVTGINPSAGGDDEERESRAYHKYRELQAGLELCQHQVIEMASHRGTWRRGWKRFAHRLTRNGD